MAELFGVSNIVSCMKGGGRLRWLGHSHRMEDIMVPKEGLHGHPYGRRSLGRPRLQEEEKI